MRKTANSDSELVENESQIEPYTKEPLVPPDYGMSSGQGRNDPDQQIHKHQQIEKKVHNWSVRSHVVHLL